MARRRGQSLGGRYRAQPRDPVTGRRLDIRAETLSELESRLTRVRHVRDGVRYGDISMREAAGKLRPAQGLNLSLAEVWERYARGVPKPSERIAASAWRHQIAPWLGSALVWDLEETRMREWALALSKVRQKNGSRGYSPKTIRHAYDWLRAALGLAVRDGLLSELPWGTFSVPDPKVPKKEREALRDPEELFAVLAAARAWDEAHAKSLGSRFVPILVFALTGLRQAELCGLSWEDLDLDREPHMMRVRRQAIRGWPRIEGGSRPEAAPKNGPATQILHHDVVAALKYQRGLLKQAGRYRENGPVFPRPGTALWRTSAIGLSPRAFRDVVRLAGLPNLDAWTTHSLRHSFSRLELVGHGGDLRTVAERTRHKDLSVLEGYLRKPSRVAGESKIPSLPAALSAAPPILAPGDSTDPLQLAAGAPALAAESPELDPPEPEAALDFPSLARDFLAAPHKRRPKEVTRAVKAARARAYLKTKRRGGSVEESRAAGARAARGVLGAWGQALTIARAARQQK